MMPYLFPYDARMFTIRSSQVYLTYDKGDPWFDNEKNLAEVRQWFEIHATRAQNVDIVVQVISCTLVLMLRYS